VKTEAVVDAAFPNGDWTCVNVSSLAELLLVPIQELHKPKPWSNGRCSFDMLPTVRSVEERAVGANAELCARVEEDKQRAPGKPLVRWTRALCKLNGMEGSCRVLRMLPTLIHRLGSDCYH
jgi:hypothetical protein